MAFFDPYFNHHGRRPGSFFDRSYHPFGSYYHYDPALIHLHNTNSNLSRWIDQIHDGFWPSGSNGRSSSDPSFIVEDTDNAYIIEGVIPGMHEDDVAIRVSDDTTLNVRGQTETFQTEDSPPLHPKRQKTQHQEINPSEKDRSANSGQATNSSAQPSKPEANQDITTLATERSPRRRVTHRSSSQFQRTFNLPDGIDRDGIITEFSEGKIRITVPKMNTNTESTRAGFSSEMRSQSQSQSQSQFQSQTERRDGHDDHSSTVSEDDHNTRERDGSESRNEGEVRVLDENTSTAAKSKAETKAKAKARVYKVEIETDNEDE